MRVTERLQRSLGIRLDVLRRLGRYGAVSIVTSLVVMGVLGVLVGVIDAPAGWSTAAASCVGIALSYELNRRWAWENRTQGRTPLQMLSFTTINLTGLAMSSFAVHTVALVASQHHLSRLVRTGAVESVNIAAWGALWVIQFLILDRFVFRARSDPAGSPVPGAARSIDGEHVEVG
ncbi:MAG: GtrA family protein [Actinomycetota bacterium]|nr:GtrA family protein [Actinomycetota bacterium]